MIKISESKVLHIQGYMVKRRLKLVNEKLKRLALVHIYIFLHHEQKEIHRTNSLNGYLTGWNNLDTVYMGGQRHFSQE